MKQLLAVAACLAVTQLTIAQWTDTGANLTTNDNVGIGTNMPNEKLHVVGNMTLGLDENYRKFIINSRTNSYGDFLQITSDLPDGNWDWINGIFLRRNGNVGIGTFNPQAKLHVNGWVDVLTGAEQLTWRSRHVGATDHRNFFAPRNVSNSDWDWDQEFGFQHHYRAWYFDGNLGIGTQSPNAKLHVVGDMALGLDENHKKFIIHSRTNSSGDFLQITSDLPDGNWDWGHGFFLRRNGNVGIGTFNPGTWRLAVNGNIRAHEIVVETGWSDFVFENDYKLPTLEEVEQHIKTKGHLKDIPNAKEVEENGIQLGEMNSKLLQKIEELTLYLIEQHKQNKMLLDRIERLEKN